MALKNHILVVQDSNILEKDLVELFTKKHYAFNVVTFKENFNLQLKDTAVPDVLF